MKNGFIFKIIKNKMLLNKSESIIKTDDGEIITGIVQGYTCYQFITLACFGDMVIPSSYTVTYKHRSKVELVD